MAAFLFRLSSCSLNFSLRSSLHLFSFSLMSVPIIGEFSNCQRRRQRRAMAEKKSYRDTEGTERALRPPQKTAKKKKISSSLRVSGGLKSRVKMRQLGGLGYQTPMEIRVNQKKLANRGLSNVWMHSATQLCLNYVAPQIDPPSASVRSAVAAVRSGRPIPPARCPSLMINATRASSVTPPSRCRRRRTK